MQEELAARGEPNAVATIQQNCCELVRERAPSYLRKGKTEAGWASQRPVFAGAYASCSCWRPLQSPHAHT